MKSVPQPRGRLGAVLALTVLVLSLISTAVPGVSAAQVGLKPPPTFGTPPSVEAADLADLVASKLAGKTVGYSVAVSKGAALEDRSDGVARRSVESTGKLTMEVDSRQQVASVSKTITAVTVLGLIERMQDAGVNISVDSPVSQWLPADWVQGAGFAGPGVTFRQLLTHRSGLGQMQIAHLNQLIADAPDSVDDKDVWAKNELDKLWGNDWPRLQWMVSNGANPGAGPSYLNENFALLGTLVPQMRAATPGDSMQGATIDRSNSPFYFINTVVFRVFLPSGVKGAGCHPEVNSGAYGYDVTDPKAKGVAVSFNPDLCTGYSNFQLSALDLSRLMWHFRNNPEVLSVSNRRLMDDGLLGWSEGSNGAGKTANAYWHGGDWTQTSDGRVGQWHSCVMKLPYGIQVSLVVNSDITGLGSGGQCGMILDSFEALRR